MRWSKTCRCLRLTTWFGILVLVCSLPIGASARDLVIGQGTDVSHLDPHYSTSASDVTACLQSGLRGKIGPLDT